MGDSSSRLDAFTDAAFAFAVSLLVIGGARAPDDIDTLISALGDIPAFAFGFAVMAMFWLGHVRWRRLRGLEGDWLATLLTLVLIFLTLIYVQPLRAMAAATGLWFTGQGTGFRGSVADLFAVYGTGFVAMSLTMAALYVEALRHSWLTREERSNARGERSIWLILAATGLASILVSLTRYGQWAAMLYATLPVTIGLFTYFHDWTGDHQPATAE
ncbi:MAG TPA: TMEM175 family protein [Sphingomicrobium sp.]|nr:TMEM175 family protein [Sphingomicrobium sp.]